MMKSEFIDTIENRIALNYLYSTSTIEGLVTVWKHELKYVLTWEECPPGEQYDESRYTRDDVFHFTTTDDLLKFLADSQILIDRFER